MTERARTKRKSSFEILQKSLEEIRDFCYY